LTDLLVKSLTGIAPSTCYAPLPPQTDVIEEVLPLSREVEVLEQLSTGLPYTTIAENLYISPSTVRRHIENIYHKLQVHSKIEKIELAKKKRSYSIGYRFISIR